VEGWHAEQFHKWLNVLSLIVSVEKYLPWKKFSQDAAKRPQINSRGIVSVVTECHFGCTVESSCHIFCKNIALVNLPNFDVRWSKISKLDFPVLRQKYILRFKVSVDDPPRVDKEKTLSNLMGDQFDHIDGHHIFVDLDDVPQVLRAKFSDQVHIFKIINLGPQKPLNIDNLNQNKILFRYFKLTLLWPFSNFRILISRRAARVASSLLNISRICLIATFLSIFLASKSCIGTLW